jgi:hypothetical protein
MVGVRWDESAQHAPGDTTRLPLDSIKRAAKDLVRL